MAWGKKNEIGTLPLEEHMLDVSETLREILAISIFRSRFEAALGRPLDPMTEERLLFLAALHDVGKLSDHFQEGMGGHSQEEGWQAVIHQGGPLGADIRSFFSPPSNELAAVFSHHGIPNTHDAGAQSRTRKAFFGRDGFAEDAAQVGSAIKARYPRAWGGNAPSARLPAQAQHFFAGLLTIADQIGSGEARFPVNRDEGFTRDAASAVRAVGLDPATVFRKTGMSPQEAFGWPVGSALSDVQNAVNDIPLSHRLAIVESETGSGKTEAALLRFFRLLDGGQVGGIYFALPTRSAASQIQRRVNAALSAAYGAEAALAVPGYLRYGVEDGRREGPFNVVWGDDGRSEEIRWSADAPRKFLAAPAAVGTIDQVLMAGLKRKWAHMRAAALSRSLLVVDEVHASDDYMTEILSNVLRDHLAVGGHAILLSATLGSDARRRILDRSRLSDDGSDHYPCVRSYSKTETRSVAAEPGRGKTVILKRGPTMSDHRSVAMAALEAARSGARVLVIRNSVAGAIAVADSLLEADADAPIMRVNGVPAIHHSRFPAEDRKSLDAEAEKALGKSSPSGLGVIVIGTQTLEQSLDIDADLLLTDPCPVDVLLQRVGRLHRHVRDDRPDGFVDALCVVLDPAGMSQQEMRRHGIGHERAYPSVTMITATMELAEEGTWQIPRDNRRLVEAGTSVSHLEDVARRHGAQKDHQEMIGRSLGDARFARMCALDRNIDMNGAPEWPTDEMISSRIGEMPVPIQLETPMRTAFGNITGSVNLPVWMCGKDSDEKSKTVSTVQKEDCFSFHYNGMTMECDRMGIRRLD